LTDFIFKIRPALRTRNTPLLLAVLAGLLATQTQMSAQAGGAAPGTGAASKAGTPIDLTGYWVSVVTTLDWRSRMITPAKGDYFPIRLTPAATKIADAWDPAKDEAAGDQCKSYGAAGVMRIPGRLHITRPDEKTLRMDLDAGTQTRIFHFGDWKAPAGEPTSQGDSVAKWDTSGTGGLKVVTRHMRAGYLRKNGLPYSENAVLTEFYDLVRERNGDQRIVVTSTVEDPVYLQGPYTTSFHFKKQADSASWDPSTCSARW
jgi:hypothetical protein